MRDTIYREDAIKALYKYSFVSKDVIEREIRAIPAADRPSIDLVRCAECKFCKRKRGTFKGEPIFFYRCKEHDRDVESDDYCAWGEREGE